MKTFFFILIQHLLPQHLLSRAAGFLAETKIVWLKSLLIEKFIAVFKVNMEEAEDSDPRAYPCFNDFFCRPLKEGVRPIASEPNAIVSPADGAFSQLGAIKSGRIFQAKGQDYTVTELLGGDEKLAETFVDGEFATIYLSPKDYHRLHMPLDGKLLSMTHIPGKLFSVNQATAENVPRLFARNERVSCVFETEAGPVALVLVGAMIVASIETKWAGLVAPAGKQVSTTNYDLHEEIAFARGEEFARFKLGSTIIALFPKNTIAWNEQHHAGASIQMGQNIAQILSPEEEETKEKTEE